VTCLGYAPFVLATRDREAKTLRRFFRIVVSKMKSSAQDFRRGAGPGKRLHLYGEHPFVAEKLAAWNLSLRTPGGVASSSGSHENKGERFY
jgi:hypothetical protein